MKKLRSGTIVELFDPSSTPSEAALGEFCFAIKECGYGVTEVNNELNSIVVMFENIKTKINGCVILDRSNETFNLSIIDRFGKSHNFLTKKDNVVFECMKRYLNEEVELKAKYEKLDISAKQVLAWILNQYKTEGIYVFSFNDLGLDLDDVTEHDAISSLVDQEFLRASRKNTLILNRTLADDLLSK